mmetsp:Transcript_8334/g.13985  ORF Transcript_8334/g.13985 Transcript_8334/m.13985 type:complete len:86 (+) Transcript_8334:1798-2055(+)
MNHMQQREQTQRMLVRYLARCLCYATWFLRSSPPLGSVGVGFAPSFVTCSTLFVSMDYNTNHLPFYNTSTLLCFHGMQQGAGLAA